MSQATETDRSEKLAYQHADAADAIGVSPKTLERWRKEGLINAVKVKGILLYRKTDLEKLIGASENDRPITLKG